ncbi:hypothetical protein [Carbonactinospora thermoautotrophica]|uniref:hypothetical protein n=1 Tax=Carbonactinospora thermoautotrophica TaxID=1469144 RepID=UPI000AF6E394|nr:hypothetical protein [Carbonactinospora thermoautotrophica]
MPPSSAAVGLRGSLAAPAVHAQSGNSSRCAVESQVSHTTSPARPRSVKTWREKSISLSRLGRR